jgi:uncharacterized protein YqhQ
MDPAALKAGLAAGGGGVSYELIRLAGKYYNFLTPIISAPGMALQRLTTSEPDDSMIEVAIAAMKEVIPGEGA